MRRLVRAGRPFWDAAPRRPDASSEQFRAPEGTGMSIAAAMVMLAARTWQAAAQPASHRQEPATMPVSSL